jgi:uncharacterized membrane protein
MMPAVIKTGASHPSLDLPTAGSDTRHSPHHFVLATRATAVLALLGLIALGLAWELWLAPTGSRWLAFKVLPLLIPLAGLLKHRLYTYRWVSLLVWLYFIEGIVRATGLPGGARSACDDKTRSGPAAAGYCAGAHQRERRTSGTGTAKSRGRSPSVSGRRRLEGIMSSCR